MKSSVVERLRDSPEGPGNTAKRLFCGFLVLTVFALGLFTIVSWVAPSWVFDVCQRLKYPDYYAWRDSGAEFPERFWPGFNTDRRRDEIFVGKTLIEIRSAVPIVVPAERRPGPQSWQLKQSLWTLEFNEAGRCVRVFLDKG